MLNEETLAQKFVKKGFWLYLFTFLGAPLGYIIKIILARDLSMNDYGLFYGIISLLTLLAAINDLAGTENLNYFLPKYIIEKKYWKVKYLLLFVFKIQMTVSILMMSIIFFFADYIAIHHFKDPQASNILKIFSLFFLGTNLIHICTALFSATQNTKLQKATDFTRTLSSVILILLIFFLDSGSLLTYAWAWIWGIGIGIIFAWYFFYKNYYKKYLQSIPREFDVDLRKSFIKYAIPVFLTANISLLLSQIDSQLITNMLGNESHAIYNNYLSIFSIPFLVLAPFLAFLFPVFTELFARKNIEKIKFLYSNVSLILVILSIWISVFLFQSGESLAVLLFGEQYKESGFVLQFSVPFLIFNLLNTLNFQLLAGTGQAWARTITFAVWLPINIVLNIIFIKMFGIEGSALAVGISWIPMYTITAYYTREYFSFPKFWPIFLNISSAICAFLFTVFLEKIFPNINFYIELIIVVVIYAIIFLASNFSTFKNILKIIKNNRS